MRKKSTVIQKWSFPGVGRFRLRKKGTKYIVEHQDYEIPYGTGRWHYTGINTKTKLGAALVLLNLLGVGDV